MISIQRQTFIYIIHHFQLIKNICIYNRASITYIINMEIYV